MEVGFIRSVLHFEHVEFVFCRDPPSYILERLLPCVKIILIANRVFFFKKLVHKYLYNFYD